MWTSEPLSREKSLVLQGIETLPPNPQSNAVPTELFNLAMKLNRVLLCLTSLQRGILPNVNYLPCWVLEFQVSLAHWCVIGGLVLSCMHSQNSYRDICCNILDSLCQNIEVNNPESHTVPKRGQYLWWQLPVAKYRNEL